MGALIKAWENAAVRASGHSNEIVENVMQRAVGRDI